MLVLEGDAATKCAPLNISVLSGSHGLSPKFLIESFVAVFSFALMVHKRAPAFTTNLGQADWTKTPFSRFLEHLLKKVSVRLGLAFL